MYSRGQFSDITITICGIMGQSDADPGAFITNMFLILGKADLQTNYISLPINSKLDSTFV